mmetsp:Transcript_47619/g.152570  ORF Transcript_47619/g.152570 Transcript_47619/m.152570 type:complete len:257 (+) Transcript_47619:1619-2389(+)
MELLDVEHALAPQAPLARRVEVLPHHCRPVVREAVVRYVQDLDGAGPELAEPLEQDPKARVVHVRLGEDDGMDVVQVRDDARRDGLHLPGRVDPRGQAEHAGGVHERRHEPLGHAHALVSERSGVLASRPRVVHIAHIGHGDVREVAALVHVVPHRQPRRRPFPLAPRREYVAVHGLCLRGVLELHIFRGLAQLPLPVVEPLEGAVVAQEGRGERVGGQVLAGGLRRLERPTTYVEQERVHDGTAGAAVPHRRSQT